MSAVRPFAGLPDDVGAERWRYVRLVDHGDQSLTLTRVVRPWLESLVADQLVDRFFFIRYELGGPHLRLRWRLRTTDPAAGAAADGEIEGRLDDLSKSRWRGQPAPERWTAEKIRRVNRAILGRDPETEGDAPRFEHGTWHRAPMAFETRRYGGPAHLDQTLRLFGFSSVIALDLLGELPQGSPAFVPRVIGRLIRLAFALSLDEDEFLDLVGYGPRFFGPTFSACRDQGDRVFAGAADRLERLARLEMGAASDGLAVDGAADGAAPSLDAAACRAARLHSEALPRNRGRWYALASHLHMFANRVGALNPQEVYWSRLAKLACLGVRDRDPDTWRRLWRTPRAPLCAASKEALNLWMHRHD
ncbi:MAG: lantibiotic dehydratase C-terminal domain-containing protein [Acidobacteriota bacterium]